MSMCQKHFSVVEMKSNILGSHRSQVRWCAHSHLLLHLQFSCHPGGKDRPEGVRIMLEDWSWSPPHHRHLQGCGWNQLHICHWAAICWRQLDPVGHSEDHQPSASSATSGHLCQSIQAAWPGLNPLSPQLSQQVLLKAEPCPPSQDKDSSLQRQRCCPPSAGTWRPWRHPARDAFGKILRVTWDAKCTNTSIPSNPSISGSPTSE